MASCSLWSARATRRWQSSRSACRGGAPVNIRKPANASAASAVFPKSELFKRCRIVAPSFRTVFKITRRAHFRNAGGNAKAGRILTLMTALFHSTFKGTATEPSAKVVTDNETDSVFVEWMWRGVFILPKKVLRRASEFCCFLLHFWIFYIRVLHSL